eukprot:gene60-76_t
MNLSWWWTAETRPYLTPKWVLVILGIYSLIFVVVGVLYLDALDTIVVLRVEYQPRGAVCDPDWKPEAPTTVPCTRKRSGDCASGEWWSGKEKSVRIKISIKGVCLRVKRPTARFSRDNSGDVRNCRDTGAGEHANANIVEKITFTVESDMKGPIMMYYGLNPFWQNHREFVRSTTNSYPNRQARTGHCFAHQKERDGFENVIDEHNQDFGAFSDKEKGKGHQKKRQYSGSSSPINEGLPYLPYDGTQAHAAFELWHPAKLNDKRDGCYPWVGTDDANCITGEGECGGPELVSYNGTLTTVGGNRVHYPCGLGAQSNFNDTFAVTAGGCGANWDQCGARIEASTRAEDITFPGDYQ